MSITARRKQRSAPAPRSRITHGSVTVTQNGSQTNFSGFITTTESVQFDGLNISIARDQTGYPWVASTAVSDGQTVNGRYDMSGALSSLVDGNYVAYVSYSIDGRATWVVGPRVSFTVGAIVNQPPSAPELKMVAADPTSITVDWKAPLQPGGTITSYRVGWTSATGQPQATFEAVLSEPVSRPYVFENLVQHTSYDVWVEAINASGTGARSTLTQSTTGPTGSAAGTANAPALTVDNVLTSAMTIAWQAPSQQYSSLQNYRVGWDAPGGQPAASWSDLYPVSMTSLQLTNLAPDSIYSVWVEPVTANGTGQRMTLVQRTGGGSSGGVGPGATDSGMYFASGAYCQHNTSTLAGFENWRGAQADLHSVFTTNDPAKNGGSLTWSTILNPWWANRRVRPTQRLNVAIPLYPYNGPGGLYDVAGSTQYWQQLANMLQPGDSVRPGWEMNLKGWYFHINQSNRNAWYASWRNMYQTIKATNPGVAVELCLNFGPSQTNVSITDIYNNCVDYTDIISIDYYWWWFDGSEVPPGNNIWNGRLAQEGGPDWWMDRVRAKNKLFAISEWGIAAPSHRGYGDQAFPITKYYEWFRANASYLHHESYFNERQWGGFHIYPNDTNPIAAAEYKRQIGLSKR